MNIKNTVWLFLIVLCHTFSLAQNHSFTYPSPVCKTDPNPSPVTSTNFVSGGNFISTAGLVFVNSNSGVINLVNSTPGTYTVTYTGAICGCFTNAPVTSTISILASPTVVISGTNSVCLGSAVSLTASGAATYIWSTGDGTSVMSTTPAVTSIYTVIGTAANGCFASAVKQVTVFPIPTIGIVANPTVCYAFNFVMTASASGPATYTWTGPGLNSNQPVVTINPTVNATYTLVGSVAGCTNVAFHNVSVLPTPSISIVGSNSVCIGAVAILYAKGGVTYSWSTGGTADSIAIQPTQSTSYSVTGYDFSGCSNTAAIFVNVIPRPIVSISGPSVVCSGKSITLTAFGAASYTWNNGTNMSTVVVASIVDTVIRVVGANIQGCTNSASLSISVSPSPTVSVNSETVCAGKQVTLIATPIATQTDAVAYVWSPGGVGGATFAPSPAFSTNYTVTASIGVCFSREVAAVGVMPAITPLTTFSYALPHCTDSPPYNPILVKNFVTGGTFANTAGALNVNPSTGAVNLSGAIPGIYTIQYSLAPQGCTLGALSNAFMQVTKSVKITMPESIEAQYGDVIILNNSGGASSYIWTPSNGLNCTSCQAPALTVTQSQVYCVSSPQACVEGSCIQVEIVCIRTGDFTVPTAFTPNGDGKNDKYCLMGWDECNNSFSIKVFDRWGNMVYESSNPNFCWDGDFNGSPLPTGVYVYRIDAQFSKDPAMMQSGNISLIR